MSITSPSTCSQALRVQASMHSPSRYLPVMLIADLSLVRVVQHLTFSSFIPLPTLYRSSQCPNCHSDCVQCVCIIISCMKTIILCVQN